MVKCGIRSFTPCRGGGGPPTPTPAGPGRKTLNNSIPLPVPDRDRLLMAYACCEWAAALTHLTALREVGCRVSDETFVHVGNELTSFTALWATTHGHPEWTVVETVENASAWLTEHTEELDALLREVGMGDREEV